LGGSGDARTISASSRASGGMLEHQAGLFGGYTREKFHELREGNIVVEVLK
jgi:hypothetical protein